MSASDSDEDYGAGAKKKGAKKGPKRGAKRGAKKAAADDEYEYDEPEGDHSIESCLKAIGVSLESLAGCATVEDEFKVIKKVRNDKSREVHPDKGGDPAAFRALQTAFEVLRGLFDTGAVDSFAGSKAQSTSAQYRASAQGFEGVPMPSWDFYADAADEDVPLYRVELAKSARSKCVQKGAAKKCGEAVIDKGEIRVGSMDDEYGGYGRWNHLACWRVPSKVWLGLPAGAEEAQVEAALLRMNSVLFCGLLELSPAERRLVVLHVMDTKNHANYHKPKAQKPAAVADDAAPARVAAGASGDSAAVSAIVPVSHHREAFIIPVPGKGGAPHGSLAGQTVVLTGVFPALGGGKGLTLGKKKAQAMIESFGGRVTGSVSGKTTLLVVGKDPGASKVGQAREKNIQLINIKDLKEALEIGSLEGFAGKPLVIAGFSKGYRGNGLAAGMAPAALAIVAGTAPPAIAAAAFKEEEGEGISCDKCGKDCFAESYFVEDGDLDICPKCFKAARGAAKKKWADAEHQKKGECCEYDDDAPDAKRPRK
ncbi:hypothetical protein M885DRAFT_510713 [Pelagophyceae sp. CCMP2097]|nr:hypothetical protein M885DRAFT_510713 [Pelagophyceae sp. CCMP2097]|mmetsp:Transcript_20467/g.69368  ORF Transcript_20467/g.69368 Transcript_20467/m.69368 type:complete len:538 (-) Transcript_20467:129-1742(-)